MINVARAWIGCNENDGTHRQIVDVYNSHKPLARGYAVKYTDSWCATFTSALAIKCNATDIVPIECSCAKLIEKAMKLGIWIENENRVPNPGELCLYDWDDTSNYPVTDNRGYPEHVGIVETVNNNKFIVIEGNYSNSVKRRTLDINGKFIRGFIAPRYDKEPVSDNTEKVIWDFLMSVFNNAYGVAGLMGNLYAESGLSSINLQNSGNRKLGKTDAEYTAEVDNGSYKKFVRDSIGYGLAQWTYWSRKESLLNFAKSKNASIGDLNMQLQFLEKELAGYKTVYKTVANAKSVREASDSVLTQYERPRDMSEAVKIKRAKYGQVYYDKYATSINIEPPTNVVKKIATEPAMKLDKSLAGTYKVTAKGGLHLRNGAGTNKLSMVILPEGTVVNNYGYYTPVSDTKWLYIQVTIKGVQYTGFSSSKYLQK